MDHHLRVNGKMVNVMDWEWRREGDGSTEVNGRRASKVATVCDKVPHLQPSMKVPGQMACKMDTDQKHMLTEVTFKPTNYCY